MSQSRRTAFWLSLAGLSVGLLLWRLLAAVIAPEPEADTATRLGMAAASLLPAVGIVMAMITGQMSARNLTRAIDPTAGQDGRFLQVNQRALTNSVEQLVCFMPSLMALAAGVPATWMPEVVALAVVFAVARLAFWLGYLAGPALRAPGMAAGFAANVACLLAALWVWWT